MMLAARPAVSSATADARLLVVAAGHVRRFGANRVTVVGVAGEAGMTHANVYRYFPSKVALLDAVAGAALRPIETLLADIAAAPDPADDKLERMILGLWRAYRDFLEADRNIFDVYVTAVATSRGLARKHRGRVRTLFERVVDEGVATGAFEPRDRERALSLLTDTFYRFTHPAAIRLDADLPRASLDMRLASAVRVVLRALASGLV